MRTEKLRFKTAFLCFLLENFFAAAICRAYFPAEFSFSSSARSVRKHSFCSPRVPLSLYSFSIFISSMSARSRRSSYGREAIPNRSAAKVARSCVRMESQEAVLLSVYYHTSWCLPNGQVSDESVIPRRHRAKQPSAYGNSGSARVEKLGEEVEPAFV